MSKPASTRIVATTESSARHSTGGGSREATGSGQSPSGPDAAASWKRTVADGAGTVALHGADDDKHDGSTGVQPLDEHPERHPGITCPGERRRGGDRAVPLVDGAPSGEHDDGKQSASEQPAAFGERTPQLEVGVADRRQIEVGGERRLEHPSRSARAG